MILELDCGNSRIKWRVLASVSSEVLFAGAVRDGVQLLEVLHELAGLALLRCRLSSVRSDAITAELIDLIRNKFAVECDVARSLPSWVGVTNGYYLPDRLGVDRWLAILAAYKIAAGACLVVDVGTAVTVDLVSATGKHLGGYICPGLRLMGAQLVGGASGISSLQVDLDNSLDLAPGRVTHEAVARGGLLMLRGFIQSQVQAAPEYLGSSFKVFLTGGDAELVGCLSVEARIVPDLVFIGLAIACP
jgi:type III pantothenate kinase